MQTAQKKEIFFRDFHSVNTGLSGLVSSAAAAAVEDVCHMCEYPHSGLDGKMGFSASRGGTPK